MTGAEKNIISYETYEGYRKLASDDIGELMNHTTQVPRTEKTGNILFDAITRAFVLGYYRGRK